MKKGFIVQWNLSLFIYASLYIGEEKQSYKNNEDGLWTFWSIENCLNSVVLNIALIRDKREF